MHAARRLVTTWIAIAAILMASLAPALSHALGAQAAASLTEICTSAGARWISVDSGDEEQQPLPGAISLLDHCPYCGLHADGFPAAPPLPALPAPLLLGEVLPAAFLHAPRTLAVWSSAQARAPPSLI